jgi:Flp pilus assembly pilin Flp
MVQRLFRRRIRGTRGASTVEVAVAVALIAVVAIVSIKYFGRRVRCKNAATQMHLSMTEVPPFSGHLCTFQMGTCEWAGACNNASALIDGMTDVCTLGYFSINGVIIGETIDTCFE